MPDHTGLPVAGYQPQSQDRVDRVNANKQAEGAWPAGCADLRRNTARNGGIAYMTDELDARAALVALRALVDRQAEDAGLWFVAEHASEAYLQAELRKLHAAIERAA